MEKRLQQLCSVGVRTKCFCRDSVTFTRVSLEESKTEVSYGAHANPWCSDYSCHAINTRGWGGEIVGEIHGIKTPATCQALTLTHTGNTHLVGGKKKHTWDNMEICIRNMVMHAVLSYCTFS